MFRRSLTRQEMSSQTGAKTLSHTHTIKVYRLTLLFNFNLLSFPQSCLCSGAVLCCVGGYSTDRNPSAESESIYCQTPAVANVWKQKTFTGLLLHKCSLCITENKVTKYTTTADMVSTHTQLCTDTHTLSISLFAQTSFLN